jgi:hypothetical protein
MLSLPCRKLSSCFFDHSRIAPTLSRWEQIHCDRQRHYDMGGQDPISLLLTLGALNRSIDSLGRYCVLNRTKRFTRRNLGRDRR